MRLAKVRIGKSCQMARFWLANLAELGLAVPRWRQRFWQPCVLWVPLDMPNGEFHSGDHTPGAVVTRGSYRRKRGQYVNEDCRR